MYAEGQENTYLFAKKMVLSLTFYLLGISSENLTFLDSFDMKSSFFGWKLSFIKNDSVYH